MQIVSNPERVCLAHALEFWTGLLVYARDHSDPREVSRAPERRAIAAAGPSPRDEDHVQIRLAS
jgi:hypothetical protein